MQNRSTFRFILFGGFAITIVAALTVHFWPSTSSPSSPSGKEGSLAAVTTVATASDAELRVTVRTETAAAISAASVSISRIKTGSAWWQQPPSATQETTSDGVSSFVLQPGQYQLSINAHGYLPHTERVRIENDNESISIQLLPGGHSISGVVKDSGGGTIAGAIVTLTSTINNSPSNTPIRVTTDINGVYRSSVPAGVYRSRAAADGYVSQASLIQLPPGREHHNFSLLPAAVVEGHIVHCSSGAPAPGMEVAASQSQAVGPGAEQKLTLSDTTGAFRIEGLPFGEHKISARGDGLASFSGISVSLGLGETASMIELCVSEAYSASGHVRHPDGSPVVGATIETLAISNRTNVQPAISDELGQFKIEGLVPGEYGLSATVPTSPESTTVRVSITSNNLDKVELTILDGISVSGRVDPPQKASIEVRPQNPNPPLDQTLRIFRTGLIVSAETTDDGLFTLSNLPPGAWTIVATGSNGDLGEETIFADSANIDDVTIQMEEQASLKGKVVTESGAAVRSVRVMMVNSDTTFLKGLEVQAGRNGVPVNDLGEFEFPSIKPGSYALLATDKNGILLPSRPIHVDPDGNLIWITLGKGEHLDDYQLVVEADVGRIQGVVLDNNGQPVADVDIRVQNPGNDLGPSASHQTVSDVDGGFSFDGLRLANHTLTANAYKIGQSLSLPRVSVREDPTPIEITLLEQGKLSGEVKNIRATDFCSIELFGVTNRQAHARGPDCSFSFEHLDQGVYEATVTTETCTGSVTLELGAGQMESTAIDCRTFATVTGQAMSSDNSPLANLSVIAASQGGKLGATSSARALGAGLLRQTDEQGYFTIPNLSPGALVLLVLASDRPGAVLRKTFTCSPGEHCDLGVISP